MIQIGQHRLVSFFSKTLQQKKASHMCQRNYCPIRTNLVLLEILNNYFKSPMTLLSDKNKLVSCANELIVPTEQANL